MSRTFIVWILALIGASLISYLLGHLMVFLINATQIEFSDVARQSIMISAASLRGSVAFGVALVVFFLRKRYERGAWRSSGGDGRWQDV